MLQGLKQFILKGNVVDLAVGVIIGASFATVVTSFTNSIINPFIGLFIGQPDFSSVVFSIGDSKFLIGNFLNALISFLISATVIYFFIVVPMNHLIEFSRKSKTSSDPTTKKCSECFSEIPLEAKRCAFCTSVIKK